MTEVPPNTSKADALDDHLALVRTVLGAMLSDQEERISALLRPIYQLQKDQASAFYEHVAEERRERSLLRSLIGAVAASKLTIPVAALVISVIALGVSLRVATGHDTRCLPASAELR